MMAIAAEKILIIYGNNLTKSDQLALFALVDGLKQPPSLCSAQPLAGLAKYEHLKEILPERYVLSFKRGNGSIKNVQWQQTESEISLHISMDNGAFTPENMHFQTVGGNFTKVILFKVEDDTLISKLYPQNIPPETVLISIGKQPNVTSHTIKPASAKKGVVEQVFDFVQPNKDAYTKLAAAIFVETKRLQINTTAETVELLAKLITASHGIAEVNKLTDNEQAFN